MNRIILTIALSVCVTLSVAGCTDLSEGRPPAAANGAPAAAPAQNAAAPVMAPAGLAVTGDIDDLARSGRPAPAANPQPQPPADAPAEPEKRTGSILGKFDGRIVDLVEAKKNPKVVEVENKVTGSDPFTASFNAYVSITSRASVLNFKHQMDILKETNEGKYPSFKEAQALMKQLKIEVAALPQWQMYGYEQKTGGLVLLEDKGQKIQLYKANKIPIEEGDKRYDTP